MTDQALTTSQQASADAQLSRHAPRARLPWHPNIERDFGVSQIAWGPLVDACYPTGKFESVVMVLAYCKARQLDPFKRPVHIVPVWSREQQRMVDTIWPGIGELRATAIRTKRYAGCDETEEGPLVELVMDGVKVRFPEWMRLTLYRINDRGRREKFVGPKVHWLESYAKAGRNTTAPNEMWLKRPRGQLEKVAEAAALRRAFPEELGGEYSSDEMEGQVIAEAAVAQQRASMPAPVAPVLSAAFSEPAAQEAAAAQDEAIEAVMQELADEGQAIGVGYANDPPFDVIGWAGELRQRLPDFEDVDALRAAWDTHKEELRVQYPGAFKALNLAVVERAKEIGEAA